jgi:hypothetical protein
MPFYTEKEKVEIANRNNELIEAELAASWKDEKSRQDAIKAVWRKRPKKVRDLTKPSFPITNSIEWAKAHREAVRERVETMFPPVTVKTRKSPMENPIFVDVLLSAHFAGVPEKLTDLFVQRVQSLAETSQEAAQAFFEHFAEDPERIALIGGCVTPKKGEKIAEPIVVPSGLVELAHDRIHFPRNTGKGELVAHAMFSGDVELISADKQGDVIWNKGTPEEESPEIKSTVNRFKPIRLGTTGSWMGTDIQKKVLAVAELKPMSVSIGSKVIKSLSAEIKKHLNMTVPEFVEEVSKELRKAILLYDRMLVFVENENAFEDIDAAKMCLFGTDGSGRFQFTLTPNKLTKLV